MAKRKKKHSKKNPRRRMRRNGARRLRRNPDTMTWLLLAGGGFLAWRWWQGRHASAAPSLPAPAPAVVQPTPPPAVSGLGTLVVV